MKKPILIICAALVALSIPLSAALPQTLNYQGRLRQNIAGFPVVPDSTGNTVTFRIWDSATSGSNLWSETWPGSTTGVTTINGLFNVILGTINPIGLPFNEPYYLEISWTNPSSVVEVMSPRQPLTSAPYAFHALYADNATVTAPLDLTSSTTASAIYAANTASGIAISAVANGTGSYGVFSQVISNNGAAVAGYNTGGGIGLYGSADGTGAAGAGVAGRNDTPGGYAVYGFDNGGGYGVYGQGQTGTAGVANASGAIGVLASQNGQVGGALALDVVGSALFGPSGSSYSFVTGTTVNFTGAIVNGINANVPVPLTLTGAAPLPGSILSVTNTGNGYGIRAYATKPGANPGGSNIDINTPLDAALYGYSDQTLSAGVMGVNTNTLNNQEAGVIGMGYYQGLFGVAYGMTTTSVAGTFQSYGGLGLRVQGQIQGMDVSTTFGPAITATGVTGVAGYTSSTAGVGVLAGVQGGSGGQALEVQGGARFDAQGGPTSVTFNTNVFFNGPVFGLTNTVPNPLILSNNSSPGPVIQGNNTTSSGGNGLEGDAVLGNGVYGHGPTGVFGLGTSYGVYGNGGTGVGVFGNSSGSGTTGGVSGNNSSSGPGVYGLSDSGPGVHGSSVTGEGVAGDSNGLSAAMHGINFSSGYGVEGHSNTGVGVYGDNGGGGGQYGVEGYNNDVGAGHAGVYGQDGSNASGTFGVYGASANGTGVYGSSTNSNGVEGFANNGGAAAVYGDNQAVLAPALGVYGLTANSNAGVGVLGSTGGTVIYPGPSIGVMGFNESGATGAIGVLGLTSGIVSTPLGGAGVSARNSSTSSVGNVAVALDIDGGISMKTSRTDPSAGTISVSLSNTWSSGNPVIWGGPLVFNNGNIRSNSLIFLTVVANATNPVEAHVISQANGTMTIGASATGSGSNPPSINGVNVNYLIINPR